MSQQIQEIWKRFDDLAAKAETADARLMIEAIRLQTELLNLRLAPLPHEIAAIVGRQPK